MLLTLLIRLTHLTGNLRIVCIINLLYIEFDCKGSFGISLKIPRACSPLVLIGSSLYSGYCLPYSLPYRPLPSTPCDSCSACLLPTVHPGNTPYNYTKFDFQNIQFVREI